MSLGAGLIAVGIVLALAAVGLAVYNGQTGPRPPSGAADSRSGLSSVKPNPQTIAEYSVPATNPKYLTVPAIGLK